jgi:hypothetical protein
MTVRRRSRSRPDSRAEFSFITTGIEAAVARAQEIAGDRVVGVAAGTVAGQCLAAGLLDEVAIDLGAVVLGAGRRHFGDFTDSGSPRLGDRTTNIQGDRVTHLIFPVDRGLTRRARSHAVLTATCRAPGPRSGAWFRAGPVRSPGPPGRRPSSDGASSTWTTCRSRWRRSPTSATSSGCSTLSGRRQRPHGPAQRRGPAGFVPYCWCPRSTPPPAAPAEGRRSRPATPQTRSCRALIFRVPIGVPVGSAISTSWVSRSVSTPTTAPTSSASKGTGLVPFCQEQVNVGHRLG